MGLRGRGAARTRDRWRWLGCLRRCHRVEADEAETRGGMASRPAAACGGGRGRSDAVDSCRAVPTGRSSARCRLPQCGIQPGRSHVEGSAWESSDTLDLASGTVGVGPRWDTGIAAHPAGELVAALCSDQGATLGLFARVDQDSRPAAMRVLRRALILDADGYQTPVFSRTGVTLPFGATHTRIRWKYSSSPRSTASWP